MEMRIGGPGMGQGDVVRVGVLGCGDWGLKHIQNFVALAQAGARVTMVADTDAARRKSVADRYPLLDVVSESREIINSPEIDAVVVATPAGTHFVEAKLALAAGKHVLVEKPFTTGLAESIELARMAKDIGRVLMVGHTFQYAEPVSYIRDAIRDDLLGELSYVRSLRINPGHFRTDVDVLWDLAPHDLSILLDVLDRLPQTVQATTRSRSNRANHLDIANLSLDFGDDLTADVSVSWLDPQKVSQMTFVGNRKMLVYNGMANAHKVRVFDRGGDGLNLSDTRTGVDLSYGRGDVVAPAIPEIDPLFTESKHFIECCKLGKLPRSDAGAGAAVTAIIEAAHQSLRAGGQKVRLGMFDDAGPISDWLDKPAQLPVKPTRIDVVERKRSRTGATHKAIVVDPDESGRCFAADALTAFEPGFDVVSVAGVDDALEWMETFEPDLLVVSEFVDRDAARALVDVVRQQPRGARCRVVLVGASLDTDIGNVPWHDAVLSSTLGLREWLSAVLALLDSESNSDYSLN